MGCFDLGSCKVLIFFIAMVVICGKNKEMVDGYFVFGLNSGLGLCFFFCLG